jgi:hypothetical protein
MFLSFDIWQPHEHAYRSIRWTHTARPIKSDLACRGVGGGKLGDEPVLNHNIEGFFLVHRSYIPQHNTLLQL